MKLAELLKDDTIELINKSMRVVETVDDFSTAVADPAEDAEYDENEDGIHPDDVEAEYEEVDYDTIAHDLISAAEENGGFTVVADTFMPANLTTGYQVAINEYESRTPIDDLDETGDATAVVEAIQEIAAYINQQSNQHLYVGGWIDDETGELVLDVSQHVLDLEHAMALGKHRKQFAIFDNRNMTDIATGIPHPDSTGGDHEDSGEYEDSESYEGDEDIDADDDYEASGESDDFGGYDGPESY